MVGYMVCKSTSELFHAQGKDDGCSTAAAQQEDTAPTQTTNVAAVQQSPEVLDSLDAHDVHVCQPSATGSAWAGPSSTLPSDSTHPAPPQMTVQQTHLSQQHEVPHSMPPVAVTTASSTTCMCNKLLLCVYV
jgi:hypothetical protein